MKNKEYELVHGENERDFAIAVNRKLEDGFIIIGDPKIVPLNYGKTAVGYEVRTYNFYQAVAKIVE